MCLNKTGHLYRAAQSRVELQEGEEAAQGGHGGAVEVDAVGSPGTAVDVELCHQLNV